MKLQQSLKPVAFFLLALSALFAAGRSGAQDRDLSSNYQWKPVRIGAGGFMRGMAVSSSDPTRRYARGDVDNFYRWDEGTQQWYPTKVSSAMPASVTANPVNGGGGAIAIDPRNPDHVLVAYTLGGSADLGNFFNLNVYSSADGGVTFQAGNLSLNGSLDQEYTGERLAIDPNNGNIAYLGAPGAQGATDGLYRSLDGGLTWTQVAGPGLPVTNLAGIRYEFALPRFDGGSGTVSANGLNSTAILYVTYIKHDETNTDKVVGGGVLKSGDGGVTWTDISDPNVSPGSTVAFATVDAAGNLWISDGSNNIYRYSRSGAPWAASATPHGGGGGIAVDPSNPMRIFVQSSSKLARSFDGGNSWTDLGEIQFSSDQPIEWLRPSSYRPQGHYISTGGMYIDPAGKLWIAGANDGVLTTTPNDTTDTLANPPIWSSSSVGIEEMVAQPAVIPPGGNPVLTVEDETLFTIFDPDVFTAQHYTVNLWNGNNGLASGTDISYAPNQPKYLAVLANNLTAGNPLAASSEYSGYSTDGGDSWSVFPSISSGTHPCVLYGGSIAVSARAKGHENDPAGGDNLVWIPSNFNNFGMFGQGPAPFYSKDGGVTWTQTASFNGAPGATTVTSPCGSGPASYTYMGHQWGPWVFALAQHLLVADPVTPGTFYAHLDAGGFWKSTDGGVTWTQQAAAGAPGLPQHGQLAAIPGSSGDMWLVDGHEGASAHGLYHTTDGGNSFTRNPAFTYAWTLAVGKAASGSNYPAIYVYGQLQGDSKWGVFQSVDAGATFNRISYYPYGLLDLPNSMTASWDAFGTVYIGFAGNSFYYGAYNDTADAPGAPALSAVAGDGLVNLSWSAAYPGGTPTGYTLYRGTASGMESATPVATFDGSAISYVDTGLADGTTYYYYLTASNGIGVGPQSNEVSVAPAVQPPAAPTNLQAFPGDGQIQLNWTASPTATTYNIYRGTAAGAEGATPVGTATSPSYLDTGLADGTTYYYFVNAVSPAGAGPGSVEAQGTPLAATNSTAQIAYAATAPAIDGSVSGIWASSATYALNNLTGSIPSGQSNSATWQGLWDNNNLYVLVTVLDSAVISNSDSVEVYVDGNDSKKTSYTGLDWQYIFGYGTPSVTQYSNGSQGTNTAGVTYGQAAIPGGYRIVASIPWSTLGVTPSTLDLIGLDVAINNFYVAGSRANKLFWQSVTDQDYNNPSLFGTAQLLSGAAKPQAAQPVITPTSGALTTAQTVQIASSTTGAAIYYTLDGSTPSSTNGTLYTGPFTLPTTQKALQSLTLPNDPRVAVLAVTLLPSGVSVPLTGNTTGIFTDGSASSSNGLDGLGNAYSATVLGPSLTVGGTTYAFGAPNQPDAIKGSSSSSIGLPAGSYSALSFLGTAVGGNQPGQVFTVTYADGTTAQFTQSVSDWFTPSSYSGEVIAASGYRDTSSGGQGGSPFNLYQYSFPVGGTIQLKAVATSAGDLDSPIASATYSVSAPALPTAATPTFSPAAGTYSSAQSVMIASSAGTAIRYTSDGSIPTATTGTVYSGPIQVSATETIKAVAYGTNFATSAVATAVYTIGSVCGTNCAPVAPGVYQLSSRADGQFWNDYSFSTGDPLNVYSGIGSAPNQNFTVAIDANGYYTFTEQANNALVSANGSSIAGSSLYVEAPESTPTSDKEWSLVQVDPISFEIVNRLSGLAIEESSTNVLQATYTGAQNQLWQFVTLTQNPAPTFSPVPGTYAETQEVSLVTLVQGNYGTIYYTTDGSTPTTSSPTWTGAPIMVSANTTIQAFAAAHGGLNASAVAFGTYIIGGTQSAAATPTFSPAGGTYSSAQNVTITSSAGATIRYTTDGSTPTTTTGTVYGGPIQVAAAETVKAVAYGTNFTTSAVETAAYTIGNSSALPAGWTDLDIGSPALAGSAVYRRGVWTVAGAGTDIAGTADQFNFASKAALGDTTIVAEVTGIIDTSSKAKAGVMLRGSTAAGAIYAGAFATPSSGVVFEWRGTANGITKAQWIAGVGSPTLENPIWLKLQKVGGQYSAYYSLDGMNYLQIGSSEVIQFPSATWLAGLAVSSHSQGKLNAADLSKVTVTIAPDKVALPVISPKAGNFASPQSVSIATATPGALIHYTLDGSLPSTTNGQLYSGSFSVVSSTVVRAIAYLPNEAESGIATVRLSFNLPTGWVEDEIGLPSIDGGASETGGVWTVSAQGDGIGGGSDQFGFPHTTVAGDSAISAELTSLSGTDALAQAGLMYRDSTDSKSIYVAVLSTAQQGIYLQWRSAAGKTTSNARLLGVPAPTDAKPLWLKLARGGAVFTAYYSIDGKTYVQVGSPVTVNFTGNPALAGLAVSSHNALELNSVTYRHVGISTIQLP